MAAMFMFVILFACVVAGYFGMTELEAINDENVYHDQWAFER